MKQNRKGERNTALIVWTAGMAGLNAFFVYETIFSPSFMMQFVTAGIILCTASELLCFWKPRLVVMRDILYLIGAGFSVPAVIMYVTGDDWFSQYFAGGLALSIVLSRINLFLTRKKGFRVDVLSAASDWVGFLAVCFALLCGITNTYLLFYALVLALLQGIRLAHNTRLPASDAKPTGRKRNLAEGIVLAVLLAVIIYFFHNPFASKPLTWLISTFGHGPEILYENEAKELSAETELFLPGAKWLDENGNPIQAHGGQIQRMPVPDGDTVQERYVWVGEDKTTGHLGNPVAVYISDDLHRWIFMGDVLRPPSSRDDLDNDPYFAAIYCDTTPEEKDLIWSCFNTETVIERPKMLYNNKTDQYVIWFHSDDATEKNTYKYDVGMAGVAVSDSPFGPFRFLRRQRLSLCPPGQIDCFPASKGEARDMNLFQDSDGTAYIVYTSENNKTLYISKLDETYTDLSASPEEAIYGEDYVRLFPSSMREAPVLFRGDNGRYYLLSSSTTGWMSNQARLWSSDQIFGKWKNKGNPFRGSGANLSFDTQCTSVFQREDGQWIYYGDRWKQNDLSDSRYIWLPLQFEEREVQIEWLPKWE
ncbi:MAG: family 43 glycosylhydrolase [Oscillospiraceae bacterium]|nr:family 43 glycosylhydrolase [Oscillospiraceae bacterium]